MRRKLVLPKWLMVAGQVIIVLVLVGPLLWGYVYKPLKFHYLIWRVESAKTAAEEQSAFKLAADWGHVFATFRLGPRDPEAVSRNLMGDWILKLQWLDRSAYGGGYAAYRDVIDTNNLAVFRKKKH